MQAGRPSGCQGPRASSHTPQARYLASSAINRMADTVPSIVGSFDE